MDGNVKHGTRFLNIISQMEGGPLGLSKPQDRTKLEGKTEKTAQKVDENRKTTLKLADMTRKSMFRLTVIFDDLPVIFKAFENTF